MATYSGLPFDVIDHVCSTVMATSGKSLAALSLVNRRTRSACIRFLFIKVVYSRQRGKDNLGWDGFKPSIEALLANEAIMRAIKSVRFRPWASRPENNPLPGVFFDLLFSLPNLSKLDISLQIEHLTQVKKAFNAIEDVRPRVNPKTLPTLESLVIPSPEWMFMAECSPNITSLDIENSSAGVWATFRGLEIDMVRLGKFHPNLKRLHCRETGMTSHVQEIARNLPNIEDLGLYGPFEGYGWAGSETPGIMGHLKAYNAFKHLKCLNLPSVIDLGMGYQPPRCGNAYFGNPGLVDRLKKQADDIVARVMHGISAEIITQERSTLCTVVVGRHRQSLNTWEKGERGELYQSK